MPASPLTYANDADDDRLFEKMPNPTSETMETAEFEAVWQCMKTWDISIPSHYQGYCSANGSHVQMILNALHTVRGSKLVDNL